MKNLPKNTIKPTPETRASHRVGEGIEISHTDFDICDKAIRNISAGELALSTVGSNYIVITAVDKPSKDSRQLKEVLELSLNTKSTLSELERLTIAINMLTKQLAERAQTQALGIPSRGAMHWLAQRYKQPSEGERYTNPA